MEGAKIKMKKFEQIATVTGSVLTWQPNGHIKCETDQKYWCKHISIALKENLDAESLWNEFISDQDGLPFQIEIPVNPDKNLWATVILNNAKLAYPGMTVIYYETGRERKSPILHTSLVGSESEHFVGYIHPGDGRMIVRTMLINWFKGNVPVKNLHCTSGSHKYSQEMIWEADVADESKKWFQYWCCYTTGHCISCASGQSSKTDWPEDLIPGDDKKVSVW